MMTLQPKRFCPGCAARQLAMNAKPCAICGKVNSIAPPQPREQIRVLARFVRWMLRPLGWLTQTLTLVTFAGVIWALARHGIVPFLHFLVLHVLVLFLVLAWTTRGMVWLLARSSTKLFRRRSARSFWLLPFCVLSAALLGSHDVPLRTAFWLSQAAFVDEANAAIQTAKISNGRVWTPSAGSTRAGLYRIQVVSVQGANVRFEVTNNSFIFSGTRAGFARCPQGCTNVEFPPLFIERNNAPHLISLGGNWSWWQQSGSD